MLSRDFVIKYALLKQSLSKALLKTSSKVPDSLGDLVFRMVLKMSWIQCYRTHEMVPVMYEAYGLFKRYEREVNHV